MTRAHLISQYLSEKGVTRLPTSIVGIGTAELPEADRQAIAQHQEGLSQRELARQQTHTQVVLGRRNATRRAAAKRARQALAEGRAVIEPVIRLSEVSEFSAHVVRAKRRVG